MCALPGRLLEAQGAEGRWVEGEPSRVRPEVQSAECSVDAAWGQ